LASLGLASGDSPGHAEREVPKSGVTITPSPLGGAVEGKRGKGFEHFGESHPDLQARQVGAQAKMGTMSKRQVVVGVSINLERIRVGESSLVAVG
jgi:hypothetical protein